MVTEPASGEADATEAEKAEIAAAGLTETFLAFPADVLKALRTRAAIRTFDHPLDASVEPTPMPIRPRD